MRRIILRSHQSPGDILMLTATVRDLHLAHPDQFQTDVRTAADAIWEQNPRITRLSEGDPQVESIDMHYPLIHHSNERPFHFVHGYAQYLEQRLAVPVPVSRFNGEIFLSQEERTSPLPGHELPDNYWIMMAGGKYDFTAKWWNPASYQRVVDHFHGRITFLQCGETGHWHPPLTGVVNLVGKTTTRQFIRLMHHAAGVVCPVTFAMHLAAAVETRPGRSRQRPCVVIAGGREPTHWEAYPQHQYISLVGTLSCCQDGGCWKSRCQKVGDGDSKDHHDLCEQPVQITPDLRIPRCMEMITAEDVIRRIEMYLQGGLVPTGQRGVQTNGQVENGAALKQTPVNVLPPPPVDTPANRQKVLLEFRHGLGDAVQLTVVLRHLNHFHPEWEIDLAAQHGKFSVARGLCRSAFLMDDRDARRPSYDRVFSLEWDECRESHDRWPSTKPTRCLREVFAIEPHLGLYSYQIQRSAEADRRAREYLAAICSAGPKRDGRFPVVLLHYQGNTSVERKDLPHEVARKACEVVRELGYIPVILDWDRRSTLVDQQTVFNPGADDPVWQGLGTGEAEVLASMTELSTLMIGIDSGPLHVAGATSTPTLGVWTMHHPVNFFDLCANVTHLVPMGHRGLIGEPAVTFFERNYAHECYHDLTEGIVKQLRQQLAPEPGAPPDPALFAKPAQALTRLTATTYDRQYYEEHQRAGLDYLNFGAWQQQYGEWFVESLDLKGRRVIDVGCACGSILRGLGQAGAVVAGVDLSEHMIRLGQQKWPDMAPLLHVGDAANLTMFKTQDWDGLHSAQSAEHWPPEQIPKILRELGRLTKPSGLFFCSLDTEELFARQNRTMETEDPTHICIKPRSWWIEQLQATGWEDVTAQFEPALREHRHGFLQKYDWDWFVARRSDGPRLPHPAPYSLDRYPQIWDCPQASIDRRHLFWLFDILMAGQFSHALEIGCLNGASSTAFVEALNCGALAKATFCDVEIRDTLRQVLDQGHCRKCRAIYAGRSVDLLRDSPETFDLIFVDGDHRLPNVQEELDQLLRRKPVCVIVHDSGAQSAGYPDCDGPPLLKWHLQTTSPYLCLEDNLYRPGEETHRGLFLATTSPELFEAARDSLRRWGAMTSTG